MMEGGNEGSYDRMDVSMKEEFVKLGGGSTEGMDGRNDGRDTVSVNDALVNFGDDGSSIEMVDAVVVVKAVVTRVDSGVVNVDDDIDGCVLDENVDIGGSCEAGMVVDVADVDVVFVGRRRLMSGTTPVTITFA